MHTIVNCTGFDIFKFALFNQFILKKAVCPIDCE